MDEIRPIDRLIEYLQYSKISPSKAEKALGVANAYIQNSKNRKGEIGSSILSKLASEYLDLNLIWVITGNGQMLLTPNEIQKNKEDTPSLNQENNIVSEHQTANILHPNTTKKLHPTLHPTGNLGMPKVITVNEYNDDLVSLVSAKAAAGYLNGYADAEYVENLPTIRLPNLKGGTHRGFEVKGHSMNPTIHNGAIAVGRWVEDLEDIKENYVYIVVTKSDGIVVKRVLNRINENGKLILKSDNNNKREYPNILLDPEDVVEIWRLRGGFIFEFAEPNEINHRVNDLEAKYTIMQEQLQKLLK